MNRIVVTGVPAATAVILGVCMMTGPGKGVVASPSATAARSAPVAAGDVDKIAATQFGRLPIRFEPNQGRLDGKVLYSARGPGYTLFMTPDETVLSLRAPAAPKADEGVAGASETPKYGRWLSRSRSRAREEELELAAGEAVTPSTHEKQPVPVNTPNAVLRTRLIGANPSPAIAASERLAGVSNYFIGNDPARHQTGVPQYARLRYSGVYPGVDLVYYGSQQQLEYDFIVAPGASPDLIRFAYTGAEQVSINASGDLVIATAVGEVVQHKPVVYQEKNGQRVEVRGGYRFADPSKALRPDDGTVVAFALGQYDSSLPLVIDPVLVYSTYLGGSGFDGIKNIAVDKTGNIYVSGETLSTDLPTVNAFQPGIAGPGTDTTDLFIAKLDPSGATLLYSTYLGGTGDADDETYGLAIDAAGSAYVADFTAAADFPVANALQPTLAGAESCFITKLSPSGNALVYSTYLGGSFEDRCYDVAVDRSGSAYVVGNAGSSDFPLVNPIQSTFHGGIVDGMIAKLNPAGSALLYSTYLGGSDIEEFFSVTVDAAGGAVVAGYSFSDDFPTANALQPARAGGVDAVIARLSPTGDALLSSSYLGGSGDDVIDADLSFGMILVRLDGSGNIYVALQTHSTDFPITANPLQAANAGGVDAAVVKLNRAASSVRYATYLGGSGDDQLEGLAVSKSGYAYVVGHTVSTDFPVVNPVQAAGGGRVDAFAAQIDPVGATLVYSTYLGGKGIDRAISAAVDRLGNLYVGGRTQSRDFPIVNPLQPQRAGTAHKNSIDSFDAFIARIGPANLAGSELQVGRK